MALAWKAGWVQALGGSNPPSSAKQPHARFAGRLRTGPVDTTYADWVEAFWTELFARIAAPQPIPEPVTVALLGLLALFLVLLAWPVTRIIVTIAHEAGHAVMALLTGRRLTGIRLHGDTSGLTVSRGRPNGPGFVLTAFAGYPAPGLLGLGAALLLAQGRAVLMLWILVLVLAGMLLMIRNFYGLLVLVAGVAALGVASWYLPALQQSWLAYLVTWFLLLAAPRPVVELARHPTAQSDSALLARATRMPRGLWNLSFGICTLACLAAGITVLAPGVLRLG